MNTIKKSFAIMALVAAAAFGQLTTTSTTLSTTVLANTTTQWCIASATGVVLPSLSSSTNGSYLFIDKEAVQVRSQGSSSTCYNVTRGQLGTTANTAHLAGGTVWVGAPSPSSGDTSRPFTGAFISQAPTGYCVAASQYTLPVIVASQATNTNAGAVYNCIDQQWTNVSALTQLTITGTAQVPAAAGTAAGAALSVTGGAGAATTTTTGTGGAGGANAITGGVGGIGGSSSGAAGAGGANAFIAGAGGAGPVTGGTGGAATVKGGAGGAGSGAGGTGGALVLGSGAAGAGGTGTVGAVSISAGATVLYNTAVGGTGGIASAYFCGATSGTTTCPNTATAGLARVIGGIATLSSNSAVISAISPAFTSTATFSCVGNDITTRANPVQVVQTSSSSITITNTTGASDVVNYICVGY